mmetsp:Transcript_21763/g.33609  ORF Transcript_21763/g.33609 Transcript_21763/m.33609 type:complete len:172 (+) Transcript_21763:253-768(+)
MPLKLVETLGKKAEAMVKKLAGTQDASTGDWKGKPQAFAVFEFLKNILENNNLIPAWGELPQIKGILRTPKKDEKLDELKHDEIKLFEKAGKLKIKLRQGTFFLEFEVEVPEEYPAIKPEMKFISHNYDKNFAKIFEAGAQEILRTLWQGGDAGYEPGSKSHKDKITGKKA